MQPQNKYEKAKNKEVLKMTKVTRVAMIIFVAVLVTKQSWAEDVAAVEAPTDEKVLELISKSEFEDSLNFNSTLIKNRVESTRKSTFCTQKPGCLKAIEGFEKNFETRKSELKAAAVEQLKKSIQQKFTAKEVQLLLKIFDSGVFTEFNNYMKEELGKPYIQFHQTILQEMSANIEKATGVGVGVKKE